jgi:hypothetical protein
MAFRFYDPHPVMYAVDGVTPAALGTLQTFSDEACTTPYATFNSPDLDVENPEEISLGSDGRASVEIWSGVNFFCRLLDADDNTVWTREITSGIPAGLTLPELEPGEYLTGDGLGGYAGETPYALPDPTGSAGWQVVVNGDADGYTLQETPEAPEAPELDITVGTAEFIVGDGSSTTKQVLLMGSATGASVGGRTQSVSVTYSTAFASTPKVSVTRTGGAVSSSGNSPIPCLTSTSATGFTVLWTMGEIDDSQSQYDFNAAVTFDWLAIGTRVIP